MRIAAFILALIGGIVEIIGVMTGLGLAGVAAGLGSAQTQAQMSEVGGRLVLGFFLAVVTIVGGSLVLTRRAPRKWGIILIAVSLVGSIAAGGFFLLGGLLGLVAGILALFVRKEPVVVQP